MTVAVLTIAEVREHLGVDHRTARRLYSDQGGPLYRLPGTGARVLTTQAELDAYLTRPADTDLSGPIGIVS